MHPPPLSSPTPNSHGTFWSPTPLLSRIIECVHHAFMEAWIWVTWNRSGLWGRPTCLVGCWVMHHALGSAHRGPTTSWALLVVGLLRRGLLAGQLGLRPAGLPGWKQLLLKLASCYGLDACWCWASCPWPATAKAARHLLSGGHIVATVW